MICFDWAHQAEVLSDLNDRINWALDAGARRVFCEAVKYRAELLSNLGSLARQELDMISTAEDLT